ncbi:MAG: hypothetical protein SF162_02425 [bacterium]|nr:hypothetical protein [bacterium]
MPMKLRLLPISLAAVAFVFLLSACSTPNLRDTNLLRDQSLLTGDPCQAPCWRGITPGETAWSDALIVLEDDPTLQNVTTQEDEESASRVAEWQQRDGAPGCCQMYSEDGEIVDLLFLRVAPDMTIDGVVNVFGNPAYALSTEFSGDQAIINVVYPDVPMVLYVFVPGVEAELTGSSEIIGVLYMTREDMDLLLATSNLHAWDGYQPYSEYGPDAPLEVTPSIILDENGQPVEATAEADVTPESEATVEAEAQAEAE